VYVSGVYGSEPAYEDVRNQEFRARVRVRVEHDVDTFHGGVKCPSNQDRDETVRQRAEQIAGVESQDRAVITVDWPRAIGADLCAYLPGRSRRP